MKKLLFCAVTAALNLVSAVPFAAFAEETGEAAEPSYVSEWHTDENGRIFYYGEDGEYLTGQQTIDGEVYMFSANGVLKTGWRTVDGKRRYYDQKTGEPVYGWIEYCGRKYYISPEDGKMSGSIPDENGDRYLLNEFGSMVEEGGFTEYDGSFYYVGAGGRLLTGPTEIEGVVYNISEEGVISTGWQETDGKRRYFSPETGKLVTGLADIDGDLYIFADDGTVLTGRIIYGGKYYFINDDGIVQTGFITIDGKTYYFGKNGAMCTKWQTIDGKKYYFGEDGVMVTGRQIIQGAKYYIDSSGVVQTGLIKLDDGTYYFAADGKMQTGWQTINGKKYYFGTSGAMVVNKSVDGYRLGADGVAVPLSEVQKNADSILATVGSSAANIYGYVVNHNKYKYIEDTKTLAQLESIGWSFFAKYAMNNRFVVCYYFAAITDVLFQEAGFESRVVYGTGRGSGDHYWNQIKVNGVWTNYDTCNGYQNVTDDYLKAQNYTWKQYIYPDFS